MSRYDLGGIQPPADEPDRALMRLGAAAAFGGFALQLVSSAFHPGAAQPNDTAAAFAEYAASGPWTWVHIGQFAGAFLVALGLLALARSLPRHGAVGTLALVGQLAVVSWVAVFAVQMAVDGIALRATIDTWASAGPADKAAAFFAADAIRSVEKALSGFFHLLNGTGLLALGLAVSIGRAYPRPLGWFGVAAGAGYIAGGLVTAQTGFSTQADNVLGAALVPGVVFLFGIAAVMLVRGVRSAAGHRSGRPSMAAAAAEPVP